MTGERKTHSGSNKRQRNAAKLIRFSDDELALVEQAASRAGLTFSSYGRAQMLGHLPERSVRRPPIEKELLARILGQLGKAGSNLNQVARAANMDAAEVAQILAALAEVRDAVRVVTETMGRRP